MGSYSSNFTYSPEEEEMSIEYIAKISSAISSGVYIKTEEVHRAVLYATKLFIAHEKGKIKLSQPEYDTLLNFIYTVNSSSFGINLLSSS